MLCSIKKTKAADFVKQCQYWKAEETTDHRWLLSEELPQ